jgi:uncharacterized small protein (DUF1192 family)
VKEQGQMIAALQAEIEGLKKWFDKIT